MEGLGPSLARLALAIVLVHGLATAASNAAIRGVDPAVAGLYASSASGTFSCRDGSKAIPYSHVNDDYCDCLDGSDEPGALRALPRGGQRFARQHDEQRVAGRRSGRLLALAAGAGTGKGQSG